MSRVVVLPQRGTLLVATDLHGHLADLRAVVARFLALAASEPAPPQLVICGLRSLHPDAPARHRRPQP